MQARSYSHLVLFSNAFIISILLVPSIYLTGFIETIHSVGPPTVASVALYSSPFYSFPILTEDTGINKGMRAENIKIIEGQSIQSLLLCGVAMNRITLVLLLVLTLLSAGCAERDNDVQNISDDAVIVHLTYGAFTLPEMAIQELIVNETSVNLSYYAGDRELTRRYVRPLNESARSDLLRLFRDNQFLEMEDTYVPQEGQPIVTDVGVVEISLIQDDLNKTVKVDPYYEDYMPQDLREIDRALVDLRTYAMSTSPEEARAMAGEWITNAPTYAYDGSNLTLVDQVLLDSFPEQHEITYEFLSSHAGYGNRSGEAAAQVITPHTAVIRVGDGEVTSAVIDGVWDEKYQRMLSDMVTMEASMRCDEVPWMQWYESGDIQFPAEPSEEEIAIAYFDEVYSVEITGLEDISESIDTCSYSLQVRQRDIRTMEDLGWVEARPSTFYLLT
jgi:hypothetical protein